MYVGKKGKFWQNEDDTFTVDKHVIIKSTILSHSTFKYEYVSTSYDMNLLEMSVCMSVKCNILKMFWRNVDDKFTVHKHVIIRPTIIT